MFKSIKTKIILMVMTLFAMGILLMTFMINDQAKKKSIANAVDSINTIVNEIRFGIYNLLGIYENGLELLATSDVSTYFTKNGKVAGVIGLDIELAALTEEISSRDIGCE